MVEDLGTIRQSRNGRRLYTVEQKAKLIHLWDSSGRAAAEFAREHGILVGQLYKWRHSFQRGGRIGLKSQGEVYPYEEVAALKKRIAELERLLGRKTAELEIWQAAKELGYIKKKTKP